MRATGTTKDEVHDRTGWRRICVCRSYPTSNWERLEEEGGDADVLVARSAISSFTRRVSTVIGGEDTDVLELLCHQADTQTQELYYR